MSTNEINQSLDEGERLVEVGHREEINFASSQYLQGEHNPHGPPRPHGRDGADAQNTIVPRLAVGVVIVIFIAAVGSPRSKNLAGVPVGAEAPGEALLHVGLDRNGFRIIKDGDHGDRLASEADTGHEFDLKMEDCTYVLCDRSRKEGGSPSSPRNLIVVPWPRRKDSLFSRNWRRRVFVFDHVLGEGNGGQNFGGWSVVLALVGVRRGVQTGNI